MRYSDVFGSCHPAVNFLYFVLVIAFSMCLTHPVCLLLSVCGAVIYHAVLLGPRSLRKSAVWMIPMAVLAAVINPAFTHQGVTILAYLPSGNPLTLESMLYGLASAALLSATLLWFTCYNTVMTSDKYSPRKPSVPKYFPIFIFLLNLSIFSFFIKRSKP